MKNSPIAIFLYNRPEKTISCLNSISANIDFNDSPLYIFIDGPKNNNDKIKINEIKKIISSFNFMNLVEINFKETNIGLAKSIFFGVNYVLSKHDTIIVLEDDLTFNKGFLIYMNNCLDKYRSKNIYQVCGYLWGNNMRDFINTPYIIPNINSWGWATWKEKWTEFELGKIKKDELKNFDSNDINKFNLHGSYDYFKILKKHFKGKVDSWAIQWYYHVFKNNGFSVYPNSSLVINGGMDGSGTHTISRKYTSQVSEDLKISYPDKLTFNMDLYRRFCVELKKINNETLLSKILFRALRYLKK